MHGHLLPRNQKPTCSRTTISTITRSGPRDSPTHLATPRPDSNANTNSKSHNASRCCLPGIRRPERSRRRPSWRRVAAWCSIARNFCAARAVSFWPGARLARSGGCSSGYAAALRAAEGAPGRPDPAGILELLPGEAGLRHAVQRHETARDRLLRRLFRRRQVPSLGAAVRCPVRRPQRRSQLRRLLDDERPRDRRLAPEGCPPVGHDGHDRRRRTADRHLLDALEPPAHDPRRLLPNRRNRRARPRRRRRIQLAPPRNDVRQHRLAHPRRRHRQGADLQQERERRPLLGVPRRRGRELRHRHVVQVPRRMRSATYRRSSSNGPGARRRPWSTPGSAGRRTLRTASTPCASWGRKAVACSYRHRDSSSARRRSSSRCFSRCSWVGRRKSTWSSART